MEIPSVFQRTLSEVYASYELGLVCHDADNIRRSAVDALCGWPHPRLRTTSQSRKTNGVKFWESYHGFATQLNGLDVNFSLACEEPERKPRRINVSGKVISLIINGDFFQPAALILPPDADRISATVIVGNEVNNPTHLQEIYPIVEAIRVPLNR